MELFEQIRREYEHGVGTIKGVARKFQVHRRMVREAIGSAIPKPRKEPHRERPKLGAVSGWIDSVLEADRKAPRKQRHTAHRIWTRLKQEHPGADVAESTVREYVRMRKMELGLQHGEVFVPQSYRWGQEGQVDWYEAWAEIDGEEQKVYVFCMRSMASGGAFHRAYPHAGQQAFLEAHELAFAYFGGVFEVLRYDNLSSAVKRVLRGSQREETERFIAFRSHWGFRSEFCTPGEGHEKGGVESENGYYRRNPYGQIIGQASFQIRINDLPLVVTMSLLVTETQASSQFEFSDQTPSGHATGADVFAQRLAEPLGGFWGDPVFKDEEIRAKMGKP